MGKIIYKPAGSAGEYSEWAANLYVGCSNNCSYCYLKHGLTKGTLGGDTPVLKVGAGANEDEAYDNFCKELDRYKQDILKDNAALFFTFTSDPCLKDTIDLNWKCIRYSVEKGVPVKILTKRADWLNHPIVVEVLAKYPQLLRIGFTLTGRDDLEPESSSNDERIAAMDTIHKMGIYTWGSFEPVISLSSSMYVIMQCFDKQCCDEYKIGLVTGVKREYTKEQVLDFQQTLIPLIGTKVHWKKSLIEFITPGKKRKKLELPKATNTKKQKWSDIITQLEYILVNSGLSPKEQLKICAELLQKHID